MLELCFGLIRIASVGECCDNIFLSDNQMQLILCPMKRLQSNILTMRFGAIPTKIWVYWPPRRRSNMMSPSI